MEIPAYTPAAAVSDDDDGAGMCAVMRDDLVTCCTALTYMLHRRSLRHGRGRWHGLSLVSVSLALTPFFKIQAPREEGFAIDTEVYGFGDEAAAEAETDEGYLKFGDDE